MQQIHYETKYTRNQKEKERIFSVAMDLMKAVGYDNLTIRSICEHAKISTGMFYRHFESKEALLAFYYFKADIAFKEQLKAQIQGEDVKQQIVSFYTWYTSYTASFGLDFCQNFFNTKNLTMNTDRVYNQVIEITSDCIREAINKGYQLPEGQTPYDISRDACVVVKGAIFDWCAHDGDYNLSVYVNELVTRCVNGLM